MVGGIGSNDSLATAPNIVFILADDMGWTGTSVQMDPLIPGSKSDYYQTPRLEQMAAAGMRFSQGYASSPICATTRAAIVTGRSNAALQMGDLPHALPEGSTRWVGAYEDHVLTPPTPEVFDPTGLTLPRMMKQVNPSYVTAHYGKWHLDVPPATTAQTAGYDFAGELNPLPPDEVDPWGVFALAGIANSFMQDRVNSNQPFFLQVSEKSVHNPVRSRQAIRDKYAALPKGAIHKDPAFAAMTEDLDTSIGMILDKIDQLGIADNTYVIYSSDNGSPIAYSSNSPLNNGKATVREGGIRVPFIVKGPNIAPGTFSNIPVTLTDIFATVSDLIGNPNPLPANVESGSFAPILHNAGQLPVGMDHIQRNLHEAGEVYFHWPMNFGGFVNTLPSSAIRDGDYKLFVEWGAYGQADKLYLYNLVTNVSETNNLATSMPTKAAELKAKLVNHLDLIDAPFAYDVKQPVSINWDASVPGAEATGWRSTTDLRYKGRENWKLGTGTQQPVLANTSAFQPGLPNKAFHFDGNDVMKQNFVQVGDDGPRAVILNPGTPDWDRSATMEFWVRLDSLTQSGILMESGGITGGISVTLGDADNDGLKNDLRFRVLGLVGADTGTGVLKDFTATTKINQFADPTRDFVHLVTVFNDDPNNRYQEIYVNGALASRVNATLGPNESPQRDTYDQAGLGGMGGVGIGANGGTGSLPFSGGFRGEFGKVVLYNYAVTGSTVQSNYNSVLTPADYGVTSLAGNVSAPTTRPTNLTLGAAESAAVQIIHERVDALTAPLMVDAIINGGVTLSSAGQATPGQLPGGTKFSSYLLDFDPLGQANAAATGSVSFAGNILGILFNQSTLVSTDSLLGSIGNYGFTADRGLSLGAGGSLTVSADRRTLNFNLSVLGNDLTQFRVLTAALIESDFNHDGLVNNFDLSIWQASFGLDAAGDADGDGDTDGRDFMVWQRQYTSSALTVSADFNDSGTVDNADLAILQQAYGVNVGGDADGDGDTDGRDFLVWQRQYTSSALTVSADFNHSGTVDNADLAILQQSYGVNAGGDADGDNDTDGKDFLVWQRGNTAPLQSLSTSTLSTLNAVPEPTSLLLVTAFAGLSTLLPRTTLKNSLRS